MAALYGIQKPRNRAFLVLVQTKERSPLFLDECEEEMRELARAALVSVVGVVRSKVQDPSPSHFIRSGKLEQVILEAKQKGANTLLFNVDLSPVQARNLEKEITAVVYDSRKIVEGCLFVCIKGANFDGHQAAAEAARRALLNETCRTLRLPPEKYEQWKVFKYNFDPSMML